MSELTLNGLPASNQVIFFYRNLSFFLLPVIVENKHRHFLPATKFARKGFLKIFHILRVACRKSREQESFEVS